MKNKLGIIGAGVMGQAILNCVINKNFLSKNEIGIYEISEEKLHKLNQDGYKTYDSANKLANDSEFILISIKPQQFELLAADMKINDETTIISIMAGIKSETILNKIKGALSVARVMPNTPCRIGKGVCAISFNNVENKNQDFIRNLLGCCGIVVDVEENLIRVTLPSRQREKGQPFLQALLLHLRLLAQDYEGTIQVNLSEVYNNA